MNFRILVNQKLWFCWLRKEFSMIAINFSVGENLRVVFIHDVSDHSSLQIRIFLYLSNVCPLTITPNSYSSTYWNMLLSHIKQCSLPRFLPSVYLVCVKFCSHSFLTIRPINVKFRFLSINIILFPCLSAAFCRTVLLPQDFSSSVGKLASILCHIGGLHSAGFLILNILVS